jgi:hypothetical protein
LPLLSNTIDDGLQLKPFPNSPVGLPFRSNVMTSLPEESVPYHCVTNRFPELLKAMPFAWPSVTLVSTRTSVQSECRHSTVPSAMEIRISPAWNAGLPATGLKASGLSATFTVTTVSG